MKTTYAWLILVAACSVDVSNETTSPPSDDEVCQECTEPHVEGMGTCAPAVQSCASDDTCGGWIQCADNCAMDATCLEDCNTQYAAAQMLYQPVLDCICNRCANECAAACTL